MKNDRAACSDVGALITRYVDEDLPAADRGAVEAHVRQCGTCAAQLVAEREVRGALRRHAQALREVAIPDTLRARLAESARTAKPDPRTAATQRTLRTRVMRGALAASIAIGVGVWLTAVVTRQSTTVLAAQLTADHLKCFLTNGDDGVLDPRSVAAFLRERYHFHAAVPASHESLGLRLVGARRCITGEGTNAHILYTWQGEPVSLYMLPDTAHTPEAHHLLGHATSMWSAPNGSYVLVMPDAGARGAALVDYMHQATAQPW
jgi:hypothetical protein